LIIRLRLTTVASRLPKEDHSAPPRHPDPLSSCARSRFVRRRGVRANDHGEPEPEASDLDPERACRHWPLLAGDQGGKYGVCLSQIAIDPTTNKLLADASIEDQTRRVLDNLKAVLEADGLSVDHVVSTTVFLKDINEFGKMNEVYATYFKNAPPARATVEVARLPRDVRVEISAIAVRP
jgi:reactive intermediate/imine deaminase